MSAVFDYDAPTWKMNGTGTADITVTNLTVQSPFLFSVSSAKRH
jgi:hypothetical protein